MQNFEVLLKEAEKLAFAETEKYGTPIFQHIEISRKKSIELAKELSANIEVVEIGTLMMDCKIGESIAEGKLSEHAQLSAEYTKDLLEKYPNIAASDRDNIINCVLEHHGREKFFSLESEICCNADCYRFLTVVGIAAAIRYFREMPFTDLVDLLDNKIEEKWNALSLDLCREEVRGDYEIVKKFVRQLKAS